MNRSYFFVSEAINIHNALSTAKRLGIEGIWKDNLLSSGFVTAFAGMSTILTQKHASLPQEIRKTIQKNLFDKITSISKQLATKLQNLSSDEKEVATTLIFFRLCAFSIYQLETKFFKKFYGLYKAKGILNTESQKTVLSELLKELRFEVESRYDQYVADTTGDYTKRELSITLDYNEMSKPPLTKQRQDLRKKSEDLDHEANVLVIKKIKKLVTRQLGIPIARKFIESISKEI